MGEGDGAFNFDAPEAKKKKYSGRFRWNDDHEEELRTAFSFVKTKNKLPKLTEIDDKIVNCPILYVHYKAGRVSRSAVKNKIDRIFNITVKSKSKN